MTKQTNDSKNVMFKLKAFLFILCGLLEGFSKRKGTSFQNGKARGQSGHDSTSTSGVGVAILSNKFKTSLRWFSYHDQNAWDSRKFCTHKRDDVVWNYIRTHFQDKLVLSFVLFGVFGKIYRYIYAGFPKGNTIVASAGSKILGLSTLVIEQGLND